MKKLLTIIMLLLSLIVLASCGGEQPGTPEQPPENPPAENEKITYLYLVKAEDSPALSDVVSEIYSRNNRMMSVVDVNNPAAKGEIIFGTTDRTATTEAKAALDALIASSGGNDAGYVFYKAEDGNIAVVWCGTYAADMAIETFVSDYSNLDTLSAMRPGVLFSNSYNIEQYVYDKTWGELEKTADPDVFAALVKLSKMYDGSAIVDWMANLWEPFICVCGECDPEGEMSCYGGAFYYANSARDYKGFLPDMENTYFVLNWMQANGALKKYGDALPEDIKAKLIKFTQSLQSEADGYFYHPQWGTNITTDRRGRDLRNATGVLEALGAKALYPTALDRLEGKATAALTERLGISAAVAVSAVVSVAEFEDSLGSEAEYMTWLVEITKGDDMFVNSAGAHVINSVQGQIEAAGYLDITLDYLDAQQEKLFKEQKAAYDADPVNNPEPTGLWQRTVDYNAVWGLLKLAPFYTSGNREIKYAEYAIKTCVGCIMIDADEGGDYHMNDVYNQWSGASNLVNNVKKHNPGILDKIYAIASEHVTEMIDKTVAKLAKFIHEDGTYGYNQGTSAPSLYGSLVSLGLPEGDVNATNLACSMYRSVFTVLGVDVIPLCDYRDGERFIEIISNATTVYFDKKDVPRPDPIFFDEEPTTMETNFNGGSATVVKDPKNPDNSVLKIQCTPDASSGDWVVFDQEYSDKAHSCYIMEFDLYVEHISATNWTGNAFQIRIGESYMIEVVRDTDKGNVFLRDNSTTSSIDDTTDLGCHFNYGEWINIRLEYYKNYKNDGTPIIKVFINDTLTCTSTNYYGSLDKEYYTQARFMALKAVDATIYIDNALFMCEQAEYTDSIYPTDYIPEV